MIRVGAAAPQTGCARSALESTQRAKFLSVVTVSWFYLSRRLVLAQAALVARYLDRGNTSSASGRWDGRLTFSGRATFLAPCD